MERRIYEAKVTRDNVLEVSFFTGEVKELDVKKLGKSRNKYKAFAYEDALVGEPVISDNNKEIKLCIKCDGEESEHTIDAETVYAEGTSVEARYVENANIQLAGKLSAIREELHMTQKDLEMASGIHQADISRIERGIGNPSLETIVRLADAMKCRVRIEFEKDPKLNEELLYSGIAAEYLPSYKSQGDYIVRDISNLPKKMDVELIEGVLYDAQPSGYVHQDIVFALYRMFSDYARENAQICEVLDIHSGVRASANMDCKSYVKPDLAVVCNGLKVVENGCVVGGPDFVCEVTTPATKERDCLNKLRLYESIGVREYWIIEPENKQLTVYKSANGYKESDIYSGNEVAQVGVFNGDLTINLKGLWRFTEV